MKQEENYNILEKESKLRVIKEFDCSAKVIIHEIFVNWNSVSSEYTARSCDITKRIKLKNN